MTDANPPDLNLPKLRLPIRRAAPPGTVLAINVDVGLGKTEAAIRVILKLQHMADERLAEIKQQIAQATDDATIKTLEVKRVELKRLKRVVFAVPQHRLGDEIVKRCESAGLSAAVFRGRLAENPNAPGHQMCAKPEQVSKAVSAGLSVASTMCRVTLYGEEVACEHFHMCPYQTQFEDLYRADVAVVAHASLFHKMPAINKRDTLIIDETFIFAGLRGVAETGNKLLLSLDELSLVTDTVYCRGKEDLRHTDALHHLRCQVADAIEKQPLGNLGRDPLEVAGLRGGEIRDAVSWEWSTATTAPVYPGMPEEAFKDALRSARSNRGLRKRVMFWNALRDLLDENDWQIEDKRSGWLIRTEDEDGNPAIEIRFRENIKEGWLGRAVVALDATQSMGLTKHYFPRHTLLVEPAVTARMDHVQVLQTIDKSFSASSTIPKVGLAEEEQLRRTNRAREIWRWMHLRAIQYRGLGRDGLDVLVICQLGLETQLVDWGVPENAEIAHFNAIRGLDRWGGVRCVIVIGRTVPTPVVVERIAETITGLAVDENVGDGDAEWWYPRTTVGVHVAGEVGWPVEADRHPDPIAEDVRWQICEAELIQAIGRGRGVNRLQDDPLQIDILTNVCLPMVVHDPIRWEYAAPGKIEEMICLGLLPDSPAAAALVYPELWPTTAAVKQAAKRNRDGEEQKTLNGDVSLIIYSLWGLSPFSTWPLRRMAPAAATVRRPKKRALKFNFLFDAYQIPDPGRWLGDRTGLEVEVEFTVLEPQPQKRSAAA